MVDSSTPTSTSGAPSLKIGRFEVLRTVSCTPWGESYVVTDGTLTGRLNLFAPWLSQDPSFRESFERIAPVMVALEHPNLGQNYEFGIYNGRLYEVEQEFTASSMAEVSRILDARGSVTPITVRRAAIELNSALHAVHSLTYPNGDPINLLYRAPFPGRMFFTPSGEMKLSAPVVWPEAWLNLNRFRVLDRKTYLFRSREDIEGHPVGISDDIFSLSRCLLLLLRPSPPQSSTHRTLQYLETSLKELRHQDPAFAAVIDRTLSDDPSERFTCAQDVIDALEPLSPQELERSNAEVQQFAIETRSAERQNAEELERSLRNISRVQQALRETQSAVSGQEVLRRRPPAVDIPIKQRLRSTGFSQPTPIPPASNVHSFDAPPPITERHTQLTPEQLEQAIAPSSQPPPESKE